MELLLVAKIVYGMDLVTILYGYTINISVTTILYMELISIRSQTSDNMNR